MLGYSVAIGHAGDVIRDDAGTAGFIERRRAPRELGWHFAGVGRVEFEQVADNALRALRHLEFFLVPVKVFAECISSDNDQVALQENVAIIVKFDDGSVGNMTYLANGDKAMPKENIVIPSEDLLLPV